MQIIADKSGLMKYLKPIIPVALVAFVAPVFFVDTLSSAQATAVQIKPAATTATISYPATVLELFTSQGCSSCPPANKFVLGLADKPDVLTLSYSVDYWDYLGWKDTHGKPEFSARQRQYGEHFQGKVYTPQMVLNGAKHRSRYSESDVLETRIDTVQPLISLSSTDEGVALIGSGGEANLVEVRYTKGVQSVPVALGENRGRTITLSNVVLSSKSIGAWKEGETYKTVLEAPAPGEAIAILVQDGEGGPILSAANYAP